MAAQIKNAEGKDTTEAAAIMAYFGRHPGQTLSDFMTEIKALTPEAKTELAIGATEKLGWTLVSS